MYNTQRIIHMTDLTPPEGYPHARQSYSVGRWQDGKLIVSTTRINWKYYDTRGVPQSENAEVVKEFKLSEDQSRIDVFITTTEPESFTKPANMEFHWLALGEEIKPYDSVRFN